MINLGNTLVDNLTNQAKNSLNKQILGNNQLMQDYRIMYGKIRIKGVLLSSVYAVNIENIFNHSGDIPWFADKDFGYLVSTADISLGSGESESYYAGAYQANYMTQRSSDELEMTFIETLNGDIAKSYQACRTLAFNKDGTVNEPKKYAFSITISFLNPQNPTQTAFSKSWIVGVKSGNTTADSTGRSEIVKHSITFQKLMPHLFAV